MENKMTLQEMQDYLLAKDPNPDLVRLDLENHYFKAEFVKDCVRNITECYALRGKLNALEQLGAMILTDSAGIKVEGD